jgi:hypothetical protein
MCSTNADNSSRNLWLRCGCHFPSCALGLSVQTPICSHNIPWEAYLCLRTVYVRDNHFPASSVCPLYTRLADGKVEQVCALSSHSLCTWNAAFCRIFSERTDHLKCLKARVLVAECLCDLPLCLFFCCIAEGSFFWMGRQDDVRRSKCLDVTCQWKGQLYNVWNTKINKVFLH